MISDFEILKNQNIIWFLLDSLYKGTKLTDPQELLELVKVFLKKCVDSSTANITIGKTQPRFASHCAEVI